MTKTSMQMRNNKMLSKNESNLSNSKASRRNLHQAKASREAIVVEMTLNLSSDFQADFQMAARSLVLRSSNVMECAAISTKVSNVSSQAASEAIFVVNSAASWEIE